MNDNVLTQVMVGVSMRNVNGLQFAEDFWSLVSVEPSDLASCAFSAIEQDAGFTSAVKDEEL